MVYLIILGYLIAYIISYIIMKAIVNTLTHGWTKSDRIFILMLCVIWPISLLSTLIFYIIVELGSEEDASW